MNLYKDQTTEIDVNGSKKEAKIRQVVRQGCPLSSYLFNLFIEQVIDEMKDYTRGISINGKQFHFICFADDIALLADSEEEMSLMLHVLNSSLDKFKLKINSKNTKVMVISKVITNTKITFNNEQLQVKEFCYLGSLITEDNKSTKEIRRRITLAKQEFKKKRTLLTYKHLSINLRKKFVKTYIWSILLYGCESWTIGKYEKDSLEAMEM